MNKFAVVLLLATLPTGALAQTAQQSKLQTAQRVYEQLARQFRDGRQALALSMGTSSTDAARFRPDSGFVRLSEIAYDVTARMGADSLDALSYILSHELAHFYKDHASRIGFGTLFAGLAARDTVKRGRDSTRDMLELETEADYSAGFYGYLAGYNPLSVGPRVLRELYNTFKNLDSLRVRTHPPLADRLKILELSSAALQNMISLFEGGTHLMIAGRYREAGQVFEDIARSFPSREVLSNAGMARAMEAIALLGDSVKYAYPFELDMDTNLTRGGFGFSDAELAAYITQLLDEARDFFESAKLRDPNYAPAYVNLAAVYSLLDEPELSLAMASKAQKVAEREKRPASVAHARIVRGIALAQTGRSVEAIKEFEAARPAAGELAVINLAVLSGKNKADLVVAPEPRLALPEKIAGIARDDLAAMESPDFMKQLPRLDARRGELTVYAKQIAPGARGFLIGDTQSLALVVSTAADYKGETTRKIKIGSSGVAVRAAYGAPTRVMATTRGAYYVYDHSKLAIAVDTSDKVTGWIIYGN